jgi:hypothetical protein
MQRTLTKFVTATVLLLAALPLSAEHKSPTGSPAARRLAHAHKVFLGTGGAGSSEINQHFYDALVSLLQKENGYVLVDEPDQAEMVLYIEAHTWNAHLTMVDPASHFVIWTLVAELNGMHSATSDRIWDGSEAKGAQQFSDELKALAK